MFQNHWSGQRWFDVHQNMTFKKASLLQVHLSLESHSHDKNFCQHDMSSLSLRGKFYRHIFICILLFGLLCMPGQTFCHINLLLLQKRNKEECINRGFLKNTKAVVVPH
jgi:hypothetical protein